MMERHDIEEACKRFEESVLVVNARLQAENKRLRDGIEIVLNRLMAWQDGVRIQYNQDMANYDYLIDVLTTVNEGKEL